MEAHDVGLLPTLVMSLLVALIGGLGARAVKLPPVLGYLLGGIIIGPFTPGFTADQRIAHELAEVGVALLLFGVGLHFSFGDLLAVRRSAIPGALIQMTAAATAGFAVATYVIGLPRTAAGVVGLSLAIASTAVATRALEERGQLAAPAGRIALGWLVAQDIIAILALTLLPVMAATRDISSSDLLLEAARAVAQIIGFVAIIVMVGRRLIPSLLSYVARVGSRELFTLSVIVVALGMAYGAAMLFGISLALAAFFAGVVLGESDLSHHAAGEVLPMQQVFAVLFFVSVGMLFNPMTLIHKPVEISVLLFVIMAGLPLPHSSSLQQNRSQLPCWDAGHRSFSVGPWSFVAVDGDAQRVRGRG